MEASNRLSHRQIRAETIRDPNCRGACATPSSRGTRRRRRSPCAPIRIQWVLTACATMRMQSVLTLCWICFVRMCFRQIGAVKTSAGWQACAANTKQRRSRVCAIKPREVPTRTTSVPELGSPLSTSAPELGCTLAAPLPILGRILLATPPAAPAAGKLSTAAATTGQTLEGAIALQRCTHLPRSARRPSIHAVALRLRTPVAHRAQRALRPTCLRPRGGSTCDTLKGT